MDGKCMFSGFEMFEITITRNYNENSFKDDMKRMYNQLGVDGKKTVFLFTASQVSKLTVVYRV